MPTLQFPEQIGSELLVSVSTKTLAQLLNTDIHSLSQKPGHFYQGSFTRLSPPQDPSSSSPPSSAPSEPSTRILNPGSKPDTDSSSKAQPESNEIYIGSSAQIPGGHIVFSALPEALQEWDRVRCLSSLHVKSLSSDASEALTSRIMEES